MNNFKKYLGAIVVILGAILLICSFFLGWNNYNGVQIGALSLMLVGLLLHIFLGKKA
jgi:predicted phage tail protein